MHLINKFIVLIDKTNNSYRKVNIFTEKIIKLLLRLKNYNFTEISDIFTFKVFIKPRRLNFLNIIIIKNEGYQSSLRLSIHE